MRVFGHRQAVVLPEGLPIQSADLSPRLLVLLRLFDFLSWGCEEYSMRMKAAPRTSSTLEAHFRIPGAWPAEPACSPDFWPATADSELIPELVSSLELVSSHLLFT